MSGGRFYLALGKNLASVNAKMFSRLIYFKQKLYKFRTFCAICKDCAAIHCSYYSLS
jgi:hypothetical protein